MTWCFKGRSKGSNIRTTNIYDLKEITDLECTIKILRFKKNKKCCILQSICFSFFKDKCLIWIFQKKTFLTDQVLLHTRINLIRGVYEKRFYTRGTLKSIRISRLAKTPTLYYRYWLKSLILEKGWLFRYFSCIKEKGVVKTFTVVHKIPRYLLIHYKKNLLFMIDDVL